MSGELLLSIADLGHTTTAGQRLFTGLNASVRASETLLIQGSNGSGKSTLLRCLIEQTAPNEGQVEKHISPRDIAYLPQLQNIAFHLPMTLGDVLRVSTRTRDVAAVERIGLLSRSHLDLSWNTASGGERQRTLLTRALLQRPQLLVLDEPFNHLDASTMSTTSEVLVRMLRHAERPIGLIVVSHECGFQSQLEAGGLPHQSITLGDVA